MKKLSVAIVALVGIIFLFSKCSENKSGSDADKKDSTTVTNNAATGGYDSQVKYGEHLVRIAGCNDCHTPKKMGAAGPEEDLDLTLSGHPAKMPPPDIDRKTVESKGLGVTSDLTSWIVWGISYAANITSDSTGIGTWTEAQFILCMREGKWKGIAGNRTLLPPMPWQTSFKFMTDEELKAIFAYLKSTKPVKNIEPMAEFPVLAPKK